MSGNNFGSVLIATANIVSDATQLQFEARYGVMNKHEVGMLVQFLQKKQEEMKSNTDAALGGAV